MGDLLRLWRVRIGLPEVQRPAGPRVRRCSGCCGVGARWAAVRRDRAPRGSRSATATGTRLWHRERWPTAGSAATGSSREPLGTSSRLPRSRCCAGPTSMISERVRLDRITKHFFDVVANDNVDLAVRKGEIHALLGENGAGKSTACSILAGLYHPDSGTLRVDGEPRRFASPSDALEAGIGMVYQHFRLVDELSVAENIILGHPDVPARITRRWLVDMCPAGLGALRSRSRPAGYRRRPRGGTAAAGGDRPPSASRGECAHPRRAHCGADAPGVRRVVRQSP